MLLEENSSVFRWNIAKLIIAVVLTIIGITAFCVIYTKCFAKKKGGETDVNVSITNTAPPKPIIRRKEKTAWERWMDTLSKGSYTKAPTLEPTGTSSGDSNERSGATSIEEPISSIEMRPLGADRGGGPHPRP